MTYPPEGAHDIKWTTETLTCPVGKRATEAGVRNLRAADGTPTEVNGQRVFEATWKPIEPLVSSEQPGNVYGNRLGPYGPADGGAWRLVGELGFPGWGDSSTPNFQKYGAVVTYYVVCVAA